MAKPVLGGGLGVRSWKKRKRRDEAEVKRVNAINARQPVKVIRRKT
jgi:hypothetical protein